MEYILNRDANTIKRLSEATELQYEMPQTEVWGFA